MVVECFGDKPEIHDVFFGALAHDEVVDLKEQRFSGHHVALEVRLCYGSTYLVYLCSYSERRSLHNLATMFSEVIAKLTLCRLAKPLLKQGVPTR